MDEVSSKAFFLVGPTASGKSAVCQYIAEQTGRMILSADSMNLYRGMDIGTAKPTPAERERVEYAGIDLAEPTEKFSVAAYLEAVKPVLKSGRDLIVTGGTGLYVKCLTEGFDDVPPENEALRAELETLSFHLLEKRARRDAPALYEELTTDDRQNPRRLIRILEKAAAGATEPNGQDGGPGNGRWNSHPRPTIVGLRMEREEQLRRIEQRVESMYAAGLLDEALELMGRNLSATARQAIGYAEAFEVLDHKISLDEARQRTVVRTRQLAKRQMTWFRNQLQVEWIDTAQFPSNEALAEAVVCEWDRLGPTPLVFN